MIKLTVTADPGVDAWDQHLALTEKQLRRAAVRALNKTARWARSQVATRAAHELNIQVRLLREGLRTFPATIAKPESVVGVSKNAGVIKASQLGVSSQNRRGVRVGKRQFDHAFNATMPNGHRGVFRRKDSTRLPIYEVTLIATGKMRAVMEDLSDGKAMHYFENVFDREMRYVTRAR